MTNLAITDVSGLPAEEMMKLRELVDIFNFHKNKNNTKEKYYNGDVGINDVNLGIAFPKSMKNLEVSCEWGAKTVDVLARRSMFDGFVTANGQSARVMDRLVRDNRLITEYTKACREELKNGAVFATFSADPLIGCRIRFHSEMSASAVWSGEKGRIDYGMAIIDSAPDEKYENQWLPSLVNLYTDTAIWVLKKIEGRWYGKEYPHGLGRPMMEPLMWNTTANKPFGKSRLNRPVRALIDGYIRTIANASIALEFATAPQKYLLGVSDDQFDTMISDKFSSYIGSIFMATYNPDIGEKPTFGQLQQGTLSPHMEMLRMLSTQFSAATGLTVSDTGVVNDANPTSSDAILAQSQTLVSLAEDLNSGNGDALFTIARIAQAIAGRKRLSDLNEEENNITAHFKNPAMPSVAVTADAAIKIASARPEFSSTDVYLEMVGFKQADIRRIKAQEQRTRGQNVLKEMFEDGNNITE